MNNSGRNSPVHLPAHAWEDGSQMMLDSQVIVYYLSVARYTDQIDIHLTSTLLFKSRQEIDKQLACFTSIRTVYK